MTVPVLKTPKPETVCQQLTSAIRYLSENAPSPLEGTVFSNAHLLCQGICDSAMKRPADHPGSAEALLPGDLKGGLLPALQFLEAEARRHDLQVIESVFIATISLWMIAEDIEMVRKHQNREPSSMIGQ